METNLIEFVYDNYSKEMCPSNVNCIIVDNTLSVELNDLIIIKQVYFRQ